MGKGKNIPRSFMANNPLAARAEGIYIYDDKGKDYIDGCSGALVSNLGHGVKEIIEDLCDQMHTLEFAHPSRWDHEASRQATTLIGELTPGDLNYCWFVSGGSEAVESTIKMARQYFVERDGKNSKKCKIISRHCSYHGATLGTMSVGGSAHRVETYKPLLNPSAKIPATYFYRKPIEMTDREFGKYCADALENEIENLGSENVLAFLAEPIVGSAGGALVPDEEYWPRVRKICDQHDILLIADEVMTGFGRTGKPFGVDHWQVVPDIIASAKGMAAGYIPTGGIFVKESIIDVLKQGSGAFVHGHTYNANPLSCRAVASVLNYIKKHHLIEQVEKNGRILEQGLKQIARDNQHIGDVRGRGYMWAMEIVEDKESKMPFEPQKQSTAKMLAACLDNGLIVYPGGCRINGIDTSCILIAPPLVTTQNEISLLLERLNESLRQFSRRIS